MRISAASWVVVMACAGWSAAQANDAPVKPVAAKSVSGVKLASVCDSCAVVDEVKTETRKGKGSGLGAVGGAVVGGLLGNQVGKGTGKTVATVGGAVAGGVAGNEIEKHAKKTTVFITHVTMKNGSKRSFEQSAAPGFKAGDVVRVDGTQLTRV